MNREINVKEKLIGAKDSAVGCFKNAIGRLGDLTVGVKGKLRLSLAEKGEEKASVDFVEDGKVFNVRNVLIVAGVFAPSGVSPASWAAFAFGGEYLPPKTEFPPNIRSSGKESRGAASAPIRGAYQTDTYFAERKAIPAAAAPDMSRPVGECGSIAGSPVTKTAASIYGALRSIPAAC